jgi:16S rRNA (cytosine967-C5)-methyltransferase
MPRPNPRAACADALRRWESSSRFADEILHGTLERGNFTMLDRALLTETFYGILRNLSLLDFWTRELREEALDTGTRQLVRLGLYQLFRMRIPPHAAVHETVNLAGRARGLVNALLRRGIREHDRLLEAARRAPEEIRVSHPAHLIERWRRHFGKGATGQLCEWNNQPAELFVRVNTLKVTPGEMLRSTPDAIPFDPHPLMLKVKHIPLRWIMRGLCYVQDPSTLIACDLLDPKPGEAVLDTCAAPGGKSSYLAQMMEDRPGLVACDESRQRLARLQENLRRLSVTNAKTVQVDWMTGTGPFEPASFDRILVDAPCTNTGVIRRRVDVRWRLQPADFQEMPRRQLTILRHAATLLKPGGTLVYSSCSIEPEENEGIVERFSREFPDFRFVESRRSLPFRDAMDGAFAAKFVLEPRPS